jgi:hypothetical protein
MLVRLQVQSRAWNCGNNHNGGPPRNVYRYWAGLVIAMEGSSTLDIFMFLKAGRLVPHTLFSRSWAWRARYTPHVATMPFRPVTAL